MFDVLVRELSERYGLGDRSRDLFGLLMGYIHNDRRGGFGGFAESFRQQGQGDLFASWLGGDPRRQRAVNASDIGMVFGQGLLGDWGNRIGASRATVAAAIAGVLPRLIGELTPGGRLPEAFGGTASPLPAPERVPQDVSAFAEPPASVAIADASAQRFDDRISSANLRREYSEPARIRENVRDDTVAADPHVAAITAAVAGSSVSSAPSFAAGEAPMMDFEFRRSAPPKRRRSLWWLWLLIVLALIGGGLYYGQDYLPLDGIQWPWSTTPDAR